MGNWLDSIWQYRAGNSIAMAVAVAVVVADRADTGSALLTFLRELLLRRRRHLGLDLHLALVRDLFDARQQAWRWLRGQSSARGLAAVAAAAAAAAVASSGGRGGGLARIEHARQVTRAPPSARSSPSPPLRGTPARARPSVVRGIVRLSRAVASGVGVVSGASGQLTTASICSEFIPPPCCCSSSAMVLRRV